MIASTSASVGIAMYPGDGTDLAGLTRCAEQSAVQAMATAGGRTFTDLVVYTEASPPATPCGACRQVLFEFAPDARVVCTNAQGEVISGLVRDFLPHGFRLAPQEQES